MDSVKIRTFSSSGLRDSNYDGAIEVRICAESIIVKKFIYNVKKDNII